MTMSGSELFQSRATYISSNTETVFPHEPPHILFFVTSETAFINITVLINELYFPFLVSYTPQTYTHKHVCNPSICS